MNKTRTRGEDIFLIIGVFLLIIYAFFYINFPSFAQDIESFVEKAKVFALENGFWGAFIFSFLGNSTILVNVPYTMAIFILGGLGLNPILLGLISGVGAAAGEIIAYLVGLGGRSILGEKHKKRFEGINNYLSRRPKTTPLIIYLFSATPVPDDIIMIPLGMIKYKFWKAFIPVTLGKITHTLMFAYFGKASVNFFQSTIFTEQGLVISISSFLIIILTIYLMIRIDWEKIFKEKKQNNVF